MVGDFSKEGKKFWAASKVFPNLIFPIGKRKKGKVIKILTAKQTPQRLPIALAQVKAGNTS